MIVDISIKPTGFQMEFCNLQADCFLRPKVKNSFSKVYWKLRLNCQIFSRVLSLFGIVVVVRINVFYYKCNKIEIKKPIRR